MTTYNTGNPIGSTDARDLYDNAQNLDNFANGTAASYTDRRGVSRRSMAGIDSAADNVLNAIGYAVPVAYAGGISLTLTSQTVDYNGVIYAPLSSALPFTTSSWGTDAAKFRAIQVTDADLITYTPAGTGAVATTVQSKLRESVSVKDFGAALDGVTNDAEALFKANSAAAAAKVPLLITGIMHIGTATTITVPIVDTLNQLFSATSSVTINNNRAVRPDWWGIENNNTVRLAIAALPAFGGVVQLENRTYKPNGYQYGFDGVGVAITKDNVTIQGRNMPTFTNDCKSLTGGSIIQGQVSVYANNFQIRDLGIDSGKTVLDTYYGGISQPGITEALGVSYPNNASKAASELRSRVRMHNIISLASGPNDPVHALIAGEGVTDVVLTGDIVGMYGVHGVVFKCKNVKAEKLSAYCNNAEGVIFKSDVQGTALAAGMQIGSIVVKAAGPDGFAPYAVATSGYGVLFHCAGAQIDQIEIGSVIEQGYPVGIGTTFSGAYTLSSINISQIQTDGKDVSGITRGVSLTSANPGQFITRFHIGRLEARNRTVAFQPVCYTIGQVYINADIDSLVATNCASAVDIGNTAYVQIGKISTQNVSDAVYRITGTPSMVVGIVHKSEDTPNFYSADTGGLVPSLANGWAQINENDLFGVDLLGGRTHLRGLIRPGSSNIFTLLPMWARPKSVKRTIAQGTNGTAIVAVPVVIGTDGLCSVNEIGGGTANCSTWLSLTGISWDSQK